MEIGNETDARLIRDFVRANMDFDGWFDRPSASAKKNPPEGWSYLGGGSYRSTWRSPDGVAYKVQHRPRSYQTNEEEYRNSLEAEERLECEPIEGIRVPRCSFYPLDDRIDGIIAMECVNGVTVNDKWAYSGVPLSVRGRIQDAESVLGLWDLHYDNVMVAGSEDDLVIVDLGG